jgi:hypothetical protein
MLKLEQLNLGVPLPSLRRDVAVYAMQPPPVEARRASARKLASQLNLGDLHEADLDHGSVMASRRGDVTVFHASGAVIARDATAATRAPHERRDWPGLIPPERHGAEYSLNGEASQRLVAQVSTLLRGLELLGREATDGSVELEQVSSLDGKGNVIEAGAGQACVKFSYRVDGLVARGAGAKTMAYVEPSQLAMVMHAWRPLSGKAVALKLPRSLEASLAIGLLVDPELETYARAGHSLKVTQLEMVYLALPAFVRQSHLFPMWKVQGEVGEGKLGIGFRFARFHHAATPQAYAEAGLHAGYLARNPDAIAPLPAPAVAR